RFPLGHLVRQFQVRFFQRTPETPHPVAVLADILALGFIQNVPDVSAAVSAGFHQGDEILDQLLEENIVLPQRIVCVDQQGVTSHKLERPAGFPGARGDANSSVAARARLERRRAPRRAWPWPSQRVSWPPASPVDSPIARSSTRRPEGCCSG